MSDLFERMDQTLIQRIIEGAILASSQPLTLAQLYALFPDDQPAPPPGSVEQAIEALKAAGDGRGVELVEVATGFRFQVQTDVHAWVARLWTERPTRYTRATLETLALIAYRQPITRGEIEQIRGVAVNSNIIKMLEEREWIRVIGHRDVPGKPALFGTTKAFLDYFNLRSLDQLPPLAELNDIPDLEPQLDFEGRAKDGVDVNIPASIPATAALDAEDGIDSDDDREDDGFDDTLPGDDALLADAAPAEQTAGDTSDDPETLPLADDAQLAQADTLPSDSPRGDDADDTHTGEDDPSKPEHTA